MSREPIDESSDSQSGFDRRAFLERIAMTGGAVAVAWSAPAVLAQSAAAQPTADGRLQSYSESHRHPPHSHSHHGH